MNVDKVESLGPDNKDYRLCMRQLWLLLARESRGIVAQRLGDDIRLPDRDFGGVSWVVKASSMLGLPYVHA